jgi:hypothetical protein
MILHNITDLHKGGQIETNIKEVALEGKGYNRGVRNHLCHISLQLSEYFLDSPNGLMFDLD